MSRLDPIFARSGTFYFRLRDGDTVTLQGPLELKVAGGRAWITVEGEPDDWFVLPGEAFSVPAGRSTVIEADPSCLLSFEAGKSRARSGFGRPGWLPRLASWFSPALAGSI